MSILETSSLVSLSDGELLERLSTLIDRHRRSEAELVAHLAEVDARKLYLARACSSMFGYCCVVLCTGADELV